MKSADSSSRRARSALPIFSAVRFAIVAALLAVMSLGAGATEKVPASVPACHFSDVEFDVANDVNALDAYRDAINELLKQKNFKELDCLADAARASKARFSGGQWKLRNIYIAMQSPRPGHPTEVDWKQLLDLLTEWKKTNPNSITAPIALAEAYVEYGWAARGDGYSDEVSQSGWKLFEERAAKAKTILDEAAVKGVRCPNWYLTMQLVAQAQSWPLEKARELFEKAAKFEPGYQYYYRTYAVYAQPKWSGEEGDPARFAEESANRVGGEAGDALYFQIAEIIVCACQESEFGHFSWERAQKGFAALEKIYGPGMLSVNSFALMAVKNGQWVVADDAFKRVGDQFDRETWTSEQWFQQMRDVAAQQGPAQKQFLAGVTEAHQNRQVNEAYQKEFERTLVRFERDCVKEATAGEPTPEILLKVGKDGDVVDFLAAPGFGKFATCVSHALYVTHLNNQTPFAAPPHDNYWIGVVLDPTTVTASAH